MNKIYLKSSPFISGWGKTKDLIFNSIKIELKLLSEDRHLYNPNTFLIKIQKAWKEKHLLNFVAFGSLYVINFALFYFIPFWALLFCIRFFSNFKIWKLTILKINVSFSEYRVRSKNALIQNYKESINLKIVISSVPFIFGIYQIIYLKYQDQTFSYFVQKNLPGAYPSYPKVTWETFEHITSNQVKTTIFNEKKKFGLLNNNNFNSFIKRLDFYSDSLLIKFTSNWTKQQKQVYIGVFPKQNSEIINKNGIGNNWYPIFAKDFFMFFPDFQIKQVYFKNQSFVIKNWIEKHHYNSYWKNNNKQEKFIVQNSNLNLFGIAFNNSLFKNYKSYFYSNLDEFPMKLNKKYDVFFSEITSSILEQPTKPYHHFSFKTLPVQNFSTEKNFMGIYTHEMGKKNLSKNLELHKVSSFIKQSQLNTGTTFKIKKINNFFNLKEKEFFATYLQACVPTSILIEEIEPKNSNFQTTPFNVSNSLQIKPNIPLSLNDKLNLLQNELRKKFYTKNLKPINNFLNLLDDSKVKFVTTTTLRNQVDNSIYSKSNLIKKNYQNLTQYLPNALFPSTSSISPLKNTGVTHEVGGNNFLNDEALKSNSTNSKLIQNLEPKTSFKFLEYYSDHIITLLQDIIGAENNFLVRPRAMSGYEYPDMTNHEVQSLIYQFFYQQIYFQPKKLSALSFEKTAKLMEPLLKIELSPTFVSFFHYNYSTSKMPSLRLKYRPTSFEGVTQTFYQGPGVLQNEFTKDLNLINKQKIENWIKQFLYSDNPLSDRREVFFGQNLTVIENDTLNSNEVLTREEHAKLPFSLFDSNLKEVNSLESLKGAPNSISDETNKWNNENLPVIPCNEEFQVPYLDPFQWTLILEKIKTNLQNVDKLSVEEKELQISIPLIRIRRPKHKPIEWPLNQLDYQNFNDFVFKPLKTELISARTLFLDKNILTVNYHYIPYSEALLQETLLEKKVFGNIYQKIFTIYKTFLNNEYKSFPVKFQHYQNKNTLNNVTSFFRESWEPVTTNSWLLITQFSFGLLVLQILTDFYRKYGKELVSYLLNLVAALGIVDESIKEELELDETDKGFRLIKKVPKKFKDIAGIDSILPELGEIVWFFRNSGRSFKVGNIIPKGILLIGPPGTGKTLLVQAIAGEAEVPVLVQSGTSLNDPEQEGVGAQRLKNIFDKARRIAPCILFIDEIDTLGATRTNVISNPMGEDEVVESLENSNLNTTGFDLDQSNFIPKPKIEFVEEQKDIENRMQQKLVAQLQETNDNFEPNVIQQSRDKQEAKQEQLNLLMQFLVEMDGLQARKGVIVIGATNRPNALDAALTRPGRFDQTLHLELPGKQKRIEILKLYSKNLGIDQTVSWEYLSNRTIGFSAADLAAAMNESSMKAILNETVHTIQTIEQGIESITNYSTEKPNIQNLQFSDPFFISRLAYYQAGKAVLHNLLLEHPSVIVLHLWPQQKNDRNNYINTFLQKEFLQINRRSELESRIIGLYAGKAAELLILFNTFWQSDIGLEELHFANSLIHSMIHRWYFYSKNIILRQSTEIFDTRNFHEIKELEIFDLFTQLSHEAENEIFRDTKPSDFQQNSQKWSIRPWWQIEVTKQVRLLDPTYEEWYRIYLPDPEESERNEEWVAPDEYFHANDSLTNLNGVGSRLNSTKFNQPPVNQSFITTRNKTAASKETGISTVNWNNLYEVDRDYIYHGLILMSFNKAFSILNENRELLDYFAFYLLKNEIIRQHEITAILSKFLKFDAASSEATQAEKSFSEMDYSLQKTESSSKNDINKNNFIKKQITKFIVDKSWGKYSYRNSFRFLNFK